MLGWLIWLSVGGFFGILTNALFQRGEEDAFAIGVWIMLFFIILFSLCIGSAWHSAKISIPEELITYNIKIVKVTSVISQQPFKLADLEMSKELSNLIKEREDLLLRVRINNRSPFALFKIKVSDEKQT